MSERIDDLRNGENHRNDEHDQRNESDPSAQRRVLAIKTSAPPFGGTLVRDELVHGTLVGDVVATFEAENCRRYFDCSSSHGEGRREFGLGVMFAIEV
ncbi:hypothetical protein [Paenibacillus vortex]|uniref:hypothetical protein n=1 Tax=Paenibacillus vortex TaxID=71995 RepID=UPI0002EA09B4|nr:hypothetical protein [Paenibacillus vortex]